MRDITKDIVVTRSRFRLTPLKSGRSDIRYAPDLIWPPYYDRPDREIMPELRVKIPLPSGQRVSYFMDTNCKS